MEQKIETPLSDTDIKAYFPDVKIVTTQQIEKMNSIDDLLDKKKFYDHAIILFQDDINKGHWCACLKYGDVNDVKNGGCFIEFFDSYGGDIKKVYNYAPKQIRQQLGTTKDKLMDLLNSSNYNVICNTTKYQKSNDRKNNEEINTCGRHCCYRILNLIGNGFDLPTYHKYMKDTKKKTGLSYDEIVSKKINI